MTFDCFKLENHGSTRFVETAKVYYNNLIMKVAFHTLGCKVNQYESEAMAQMFRGRGWDVVDEREFADVYVINTCTVTATADKKSRQYIRRMKRVNPDSVVAVTGCFSQISPDEVSKIKGVDIITGTNEKSSLLDYVEEVLASRDADTAKAAATADTAKADCLTVIHPYEELSEFDEMGIVASTENRTRAYIKVQEGCNRFCGYCVIPYARGPVRSRALEDIVAEAKALIEAGYKEHLDELWYIYCDENERRRRLRASRGYSDEKIDNILRSQLSEQEFRDNADVVIDNSGTIEAACAQVDAALSRG